MAGKTKSDAVEDDSAPKKPRKKPERKSLYVLVPVNDDEHAPYELKIVHSKTEVRKVLEAAHIDGRTPVALSRVKVLRAQVVNVHVSTQTIFTF